MADRQTSLAAPHHHRILRLIHHSTPPYTPRRPISAWPRLGASLGAESSCATALRTRYPRWARHSLRRLRARAAQPRLRHRGHANVLSTWQRYVHPVRVAALYDIHGNVPASSQRAARGDSRPGDGDGLDCERSCHPDAGVRRVTVPPRRTMLGWARAGMPVSGHGRMSRGRLALRGQPWHSQERSGGGGGGGDRCARGGAELDQACRFGSNSPWAVLVGAGRSYTRLWTYGIELSLLGNRTARIVVKPTQRRGHASREDAARMTCSSAQPSRYCGIATR